MGYSQTSQVDQVVCLNPVTHQLVIRRVTVHTDLSCYASVPFHSLPPAGRRWWSDLVAKHHHVERELAQLNMPHVHRLKRWLDAQPDVDFVGWSAFMWRALRETGE